MLYNSQIAYNKVEYSINCLVIFLIYHIIHERIINGESYIT